MAAKPFSPLALPLQVFFIPFFFVEDRPPLPIAEDSSHHLPWGQQTCCSTLWLIHVSLLVLLAEVIGQLAAHVEEVVLSDWKLGRHLQWSFVEVKAWKGLEAQMYQMESEGIVIQNILRTKEENWKWDWVISLTVICHTRFILKMSWH